MRDVFRLQDDVAQRIATEVGTNLVIQRQPANDQPVDPATHEAYLRGLFYWNQLTCDGYSKGRDYFQQAVDRDQNFAAGYVGLAQSYFALSDGGCSLDRSFGRKAKEAALKALALDPGSTEAHAWLGTVAFYYDWDFSRAESEFKRAVALGPNYATGHVLYGVFLITTERRESGVAELKRALEDRPCFPRYKRGEHFCISRP